MIRRSFKSDYSFLEKLAIGACGTRQVIEDLKRQGHRPIELERGSTGFKIWKAIKIKRVRVPDILCVNNGIRVESRAKTKLIISMSHSFAEESRGWDYGLKDEDFTAFVVCHKQSGDPTDWSAEQLVQYISVADLRDAFSKNRVFQERPKGAEEGFESRITWPAATANSAGEIIFINESRLQYKRASDSRIITISLFKKDLKLEPLVALGELFPRNKILASVVKVSEWVPNLETVENDYYIELLKSPSIPDRYTGAKALSFVESKYATDVLTKKLADDSEHIYVKLEAAATLARLNDSSGIEFIKNILNSSYLEHRLESIIILGEIKNNISCDILRSVLNDPNQNSEIRSAAAWALGELNNKSCLTDLINAFTNINANIQIEATRALSKLCDTFTPEILAEFSRAEASRRPGIAWALSKTNKWSIDEILKHTPLNDIDARQWTSYILGMSRQEQVIENIEKIKQYDQEIYFATTLLWKIISSWIYNLEEY